MKIGFLCVYLGFLIAVLIGLLVKPPADSQYKYLDTIQFCDKETEQVQKTINNAEFRLLNKSDIMYGVKIKVEGKEQEALVLDKIPSNCFLVITKEAK